VLVAVRYADQNGTLEDFHFDYTRCCINTIVLLRMSTEFLETCRGSYKHITEEIVRQVVYLPKLLIFYSLLPFTRNFNAFQVHS